MAINNSKDKKFINKKSVSGNNSSTNILLVRTKKEKIIQKDIFLYSWGKNKYGELGIGTMINANIPYPITSLTTKNIISVKPGGRNTLLIQDDGTIYLCGSNIFGLLAHNTKDINVQNNTIRQKTFKSIKYFQEKDKKIKDISIAEFHCLALENDGNILGWGGNLFNKLGQKNKFIVDHPTEITIKNKIKVISCGDYHSCAISEDGILYTWGGGGESYNRGQCGHGNLKDYQNPKKVEYFIKNNIKIKKVSCGGYHTIVISENDEEVYSFGKGIFGQCGYGQSEDTSNPKKVIFNKKQNIQYENNENIKIIDIKCGGEHSLFLSSNNNVYACGHGYLGQLGLGDDRNIKMPLIVHSLTNKKVIEIAAGWSHSLVLTDEGNIYSTGCNKYGELGLGKKYNKKNKYNYMWISSLSKLNIKHIAAGGHHSWCLLDNNNPIRKDKNLPEPLLKSNFSMNKKIERKLSNLTQDLDASNSRWDRKSDLRNKSAISTDNRIRRKFKDSEDDDDIDEIIGMNNLDRINKKPNIKIKKMIDDYNNNEKNDIIDNLIESIDKINKSFENSDSLNNSLKYNEIEKEKKEEKIPDCELKLIYTDLNLSHRFIRFRSSLDYDGLKTFIINNYINKDKGIISYQFQKDDEVEKTNSNYSDFSKIYGLVKRNKLYNFSELTNTYTLGIVYDYKKNKDVKTYQEQNIKDIKENKYNKKQFYGFKIVNMKEIINKESIEYQLSYWIINFSKVYNKIILGEKDKTLKRSILLFMELRPNIYDQSLYN